MWRHVLTLRLRSRDVCLLQWESAPRSLGRDPTSSAFFNTAGTERLYSGVTNSTASTFDIVPWIPVKDSGHLLAARRPAQTFDQHTYARSSRPSCDHRPATWAEATTPPCLGSNDIHRRAASRRPVRDAMNGRQRTSRRCNSYLVYLPGGILYLTIEVQRTLTDGGR